MNYEEMSDFEINKLVAKANGKKVPSESEIKSSPYLSKDGDTLHSLNCDGARVQDTIIHDYCNNPNDAFPIILDNGISIMAYEDGVYWQAMSPFDSPLMEKSTSFFFGGKNPLRAAMICFLKMKGEEK